MNKPKVLIVGSSSMIAGRFIDMCSEQFDFLFADKTDQPTDTLVSIDLLDKDNVAQVISDTPAEIVILFAAFTDVDKAEQERDNEQGFCWRINVDGTRFVVNAIKQTNKKLVYISTDYVFDGNNGPYTETNTPINGAEEGSWYGWTKRKGELFVEELPQDQYLIIRPAYPFRAKFELKKDFIRKMIDKMEAGTLYPMFKDQYISPVFIDDFANALNYLLLDNQNGIYNVVGSSVLSPYEIATTVKDVFKFPIEVQASSLDDYLATQENPKTAALRYPKNGGLKNDKLQQFLAHHHIQMHTFKEAIQIMKQQMTESD